MEVNQENDSLTICSANRSPQEMPKQEDPPAGKTPQTKKTQAHLKSKQSHLVDSASITQSILANHIYRREKQRKGISLEMKKPKSAEHPRK